MKRHAVWLGILSLVLVVSFSTPGFCVMQDEGEKSPEELFKKLDADGDGKVTLEEFTKDLKGKKKEAAEKKFKKADKNEDGALDPKEFKKVAGGKKKKK
jgi:Ca2+-binding EF-hand superfamily protein